MNGEGSPVVNQLAKKGNYVNPETGDCLRSDLDHALPVGPHWDYKNINGDRSRIFPDGDVEAKGAKK